MSIAGEVRSYLLHDRQNPGLCVVIPVCANAQVDLFLGGILAEGLHQTEQRIFGGGSDIGRSKDRRTGGTHDVLRERSETVARRSRGCGGVLSHCVPRKPSACVHRMRRNEGVEHNGLDREICKDSNWTELGLGLDTDMLFIIPPRVVESGPRKSVFSSRDAFDFTCSYHRTIQLQLVYSLLPSLDSLSSRFTICFS